MKFHAKLESPFAAYMEQWLGSSSKLKLSSGSCLAFPACLLGTERANPRLETSDSLMERGITRALAWRSRPVCWGLNAPLTA